MRTETIIETSEINIGTILPEEVERIADEKKI